MKYCISLAITLLLVSSLSCFAADRKVTGEEAALLLERIKQNQAGIKTITGSFTEERHISTMPMPLIFTGKVYAEPPVFLFLAYEEPIRHIMKVSGDTVLFYVEDAETADVVNMKAAGESAPPNMFGWDPTDFKGEILETETGYTLYTPEIKAGDREIRITLNKETLMVQALIMQEPGGDVTKITMAGLVVNGVIPVEILEYELPDGVKLNVMGQ
jgi:outer membrane lipoprotein-sorting protein